MDGLCQLQDLARRGRHAGRCSPSSRGEVELRARDSAATDNGVVASGTEEGPRVFRPGGISYLRVPAKDPRRSAAFYEGVFGWSVDADRDDPSFEDGTGHVIGHFVVDLPVAGEAGVLPYVFVERVDETLEKVVAHGGEVVTPPYPEGDLRVATFRDPAGNVIGVWQQGSQAA
jgi:predicted enzyme related to lactoylglutathione lyase